MTKPEPGPEPAVRPGGWPLPRSADITTRPPRRGDLPVRVALPLLAAAWPIGTVWLWFGAAITSAPFFGEQPGPADVAHAARLLYASVAVAALVPLLGLALSVRFRRRVAVWAFVVMLVLGVGYAATVSVGLYQERPAAQPSHRVVCQESSGGGTHCPGG